MVFKFAYFVEFSEGYQPAKFSSVYCLGQVLQNDDVISYFWDLKFQYFVKLVISYQPAKFQIPQLFESYFTEVLIRHPKIPL